MFYSEKLWDIIALGKGEVHYTKLKAMKRSPILLNNVKIVQGQLKHILF